MTDPAARIWRADGVLFDLDGVLVDSRAVVQRLWNRWAVANRLDPATVLARVHGRRTVDVVTEFAPALDAAAEAEAIEQAETLDQAHVAVLPGAARLLDQLSREAPDRCAIVTSGTEPLARARLAAAELWAPPVLVTAGDVRQGKPAPDGYRLAASRIGVTPEHALVFEDAPDGVAAARAAGMTVIGIVGSAGRDALPGAAACAPDLGSVGLRVDGAGEARSLVLTVG